MAMTRGPILESKLLKIQDLVPDVKFFKLIV